jgi:hypothetical protein
MIFLNLKQYLALCSYDIIRKGISKTGKMTYDLLLKESHEGNFNMRTCAIN